MRKYTFLVYHKEYDDFLKALQGEGVLHVKERQADDVEEGSELEDHLNAIKRMEKTIAFLQRRKDRLESASVVVEDNQSESVDPEAVQEEVTYILQELELLFGRRQLLEKEMEKMLIWGDFEFSNIKRLQNAGYDVEFYSVPMRNYNQEWEKTHYAIIVSTVAGKHNFITVTTAGEVPPLDLEKAAVGNRSISQLRTLLSDCEAETKQFNNRLDFLAVNATVALKRQSQKQLEGLEWYRIYFNTDKKAEDKLMLLQGFAPVENTVPLENMLKNRGIYFQVEDPSPEDDVPVLLQNNAIFRLFEPIGKLYMLPKYNEIDLTPYFAPFYMVFFGLCLGDVGYGLLILLASTIYKLVARKTIKPEVRSAMSLLQVLGVSTLFCGTLTGGFFGFDLYEIQYPFVQYLKEKIFLDNNQMFNLALILGLIQVLFGMGMRTANRIIQFGFSYGLSTIGWIILIVSFVFSTLFSGLMPMFGIIHLVILAISTILIFFMNSPGKNLFFNFGAGLWDTYNTAMGLLGDILSYVRLFALGLSGGILASVFTSLARGMSPDNAILGPLVAVIIFLIGHAINIFMNTLGAFVHPMRLTFVEFFKNSEFSGGGKQYQPFKKNN